MIRKHLSIGILFLITALAHASPVQVGQTQAWVELPDFQALAAGGMEDYVEAFEDSLHSVNTLAQNPEGLTLASAMDVLGEFNSNATTDVGGPLPCDDVLRSLFDHIPDLDLPTVEVLNTILEDEDCDAIENVIDEYLDDLKDNGLFQDCIHYDANGNCDLWIQNYPCESWQDCECVAVDGNGDCILWGNTGPMSPPPGSGETPGYDLDGDDGSPGDSPDPGDGTGGASGGSDDSGGGGGGNSSSAGVTSTDGGCGNPHAGDQTAPNGPNQTTSNPVLRSPGFKYEDDTDLSVSLPGRDFVLRRTYNAAPASASSQTPWMIGGGWGTTVDGWIKFTPHGASVNEGGTFMLNSLPDHLSVTLMPLQSGKKYYKTSGPYVPGVALGDGPHDSEIHESTAYWTLVGEGAGATYFLREGAADGSQDYLLGRIIKQIDAEGSVWNFSYTNVLDPDGYSTWARLNKIYLNGTSAANSDAIVHFYWDFGTEASPGTGLLRSISVTRPHKQPNGSIRSVVTQYVNYSYDIDNVVYYNHLNSGNSARLVLVERGTLINAPMHGEWVDPSVVSGFQYHKQYTHFRYKQAILVKETGLFGLENTHQAGLMTHRFEPEQVEYFAEAYLEQNPGQNISDAIEALLEADLDDDVPGTATGTLPVKRLASKIVSYYGLEDEGPAGSGFGKGELAFRVRSQILQSACGCGGSVSVKGESFKYARTYYVDREGDYDFTYGGASGHVHFQAARESSVTILTEGLPATDPNDPLTTVSRKTYTWSEEQTVYEAAPIGGSGGGNTLYLDYKTVRSPFTIGNHVVDSYTDSDPRHWTSFHDFDKSTLTRTRRYHPSAVESVAFEDGTNSTPDTGLLIYTMPSTIENRSSEDAKGAFTLSLDSGLVESWTYNGQGRELTYSVQQGASGTPIKKYEKQYYSIDGGRGDLVTNLKYFAEDGTTVLLDTTYTYELHAFPGFPTTSKSLVSKTTSINTELVSENGSGNEVQQTIEQFDSSTGRVTDITYPDRTKTHFAYSRGNEESHTKGWLTQTRKANSTGMSMPPNLVSQQYFDALGRMRAATSPTGVTTYTQFGLEPVVMYSGDPGSAVMDTNPSNLKYLTVTAYPHDMGLSASPRFAGPASKSWVSAGYNILREDQYELLDLDIDSSSKAVVYAELASTPSAQTIHRYSPSGSQIETRVWHDIGNTDVDEASYVTQYEYDVLGRLNKMTDQSGMVTETQYDGDNRTVKLWVYPENTTKVLRSEFFYDHTYDGTGEPIPGPGDGNLTLERKYVSDASGDYRDTVHVYDWQNRQRMSFVADNMALDPHASSIAGSASLTLFDNMNRPTAAASIEGGDHTAIISSLKDDGLSVSGLFSAQTASIERTLYGRRGLPYALETAIDPTSESAGYLRINTWYDQAGRVVAVVSPNGSVKKTEYDGFSRPQRVLVVDGQDARDGTVYADAVSVLDADNIILEEAETVYDDLGRVEMSISRTRDHLSQEPTVAPSTGIGANPITTYTLPMYDNASRPIATVSYGTNTAADVFESGGAPPSIGANDTPALLRSDPDLIVSETIYNEIGRPSLTVDPLGRTQKTLFDDLGRPYATIENFIDNGLSIAWNSTAGHYEVISRNSGDGVDQNRVTSSVFDFAGNTTKSVAHLRDGNGDEVVQITEYEYSPANALSTQNQSNLYGNLYRIRYPQPGDGTYSGTDGQPGTADADTVQFAYNYLGEQIAARDQNGTIREFSRDGLGRLTQESVASFGTGVDSAIDVLKTEYDDQGRVERSYSLNSSSPSTKLNEVVYSYNARGDLIQLDQLAKTGTPVRSLEWSYINSPYGTGDNEHRLEWMEYPDGAKLVPQYGDGDSTNPIDTRIDRVRGFELRESDYDPLNPAPIQLVTYEHLGLGTVARLDFGGYQTDRSVDDQTGSREQAGIYPGWDRFGRLKRNTTVNSNWASSSQGQFYSESFTYDQLSNRLTKQDNRLSAIEDNRDFIYGYDQLNRLTDTDRGIHTDSDPNNDEVEDSRAWTLDELGNWAQVDTLEPDGSGGFQTASEEREHNGTNELTEIDSDPLSYDDNGNLTEFDSRDYVYDAWNRLVRITQGSSTVTEYEYNPLHWRVVKRAKDSTGADTQRLLYYSPSWRLVYEDLDADHAPANGHVSTSFASTFYGKRHVDDALYRAIDDDDGSADGIYERGFTYLTDHQFSVVGLVEPTYGRVYERLRYDAYGNPSHLYPEDVNGDGSINYFDVNAVTGAGGYYSAHDPRADFNYDGVYNFYDISAISSAPSTKSAVGVGWISDDGANGPGSRLGFMGYSWDPEAGLWLGRNRMYSPKMGRWLQRDPAGYVDGLSMYLFVRGNPLSYIDPMGLCGDEKFNGNTGHYEGRDNGGGLKRARSNNNGRESEYKKAEDQYYLIKDYLKNNGKSLKKRNPELYLQLILQQKLFEIQQTAIKRYGSLDGDDAQQALIKAYNKFFSKVNTEVAEMVRSVYGPKAMIMDVATAGLGGAALARISGQADDIIDALKVAHGFEVDTPRGSKIDRAAFKKEREAYWKAEAQNNPGNYSADDLPKMKKGRAPTGPDGHPMELHHIDGTPEGGVTPMSRTDHRLGENYKKNHPSGGN